MDLWHSVRKINWSDERGLIPSIPLTLLFWCHRFVKILANYSEIENKSVPFWSFTANHKISVSLCRFHKCSTNCCGPNLLLKEDTSQIWYLVNIYGVLPVRTGLHREGTNHRCLLWCPCQSFSPVVLFVNEWRVFPAHHSVPVINKQEILLSDKSPTTQPETLTATLTLCV